MLERWAPVLFFEYDPYYLAEAGDPGFDVFGSLLAIGYRRAIFYESVGEYVISVALDDALALTDLDALYRGRDGHRYADVCAFHEGDLDLWHEVRFAELEFFARRRGGVKPLRVCIDAREAGDKAGGSSQVVIGLVSALSRLTDGNEEYLVSHTPDSEWISPFVSGPCRIVHANVPLVRGAKRTARRIWASAARGMA